MVKTSLAGVLSLFLIGMLVLSGCSQNCREIEVKYYDKVPVMVNKTSSETETYTYEEPVMVENCSDRSFNVTFGEKRWIYEGTEEGDYNKVQREIIIHNIFNKVREFEFYKLYVEGGKIVEKTKGTYMQLVGPNDEERLFVGWNTEYDPKKDTAIEIVRVSDNQIATCLQEIKYIEKTGVRNKVVLVEELVENKNIIKTRTELKCD